MSLMTLNVQLRCHANDPVQNITSYAHDLLRPEISFYKQDLAGSKGGGATSCNSLLTIVGEETRDKTIRVTSIWT